MIKISVDKDTNRLRVLLKGNPNHDELGRFSDGDGGGRLNTPTHRGWSSEENHNKVSSVMNGAAEAASSSLGSKSSFTGRLYQVEGATFPLGTHPNGDIDMSKQTVQDALRLSEMNEQSWNSLPQGEKDQLFTTWGGMVHEGVHLSSPYVGLSGVDEGSTELVSQSIAHRTFQFTFGFDPGSVTETRSTFKIPTQTAARALGYRNPRDVPESEAIAFHKLPIAERTSRMLSAQGR